MFREEDTRVSCVCGEPNFSPKSLAKMVHAGWIFSSLRWTFALASTSRHSHLGYRNLSNLCALVKGVAKQIVWYLCLLNLHPTLACVPVCLPVGLDFVRFFWLAYLLRSSVRRKGCDVIRELPLAVSEIYVRSFGGTCYSSCKGVNIFIWNISFPLLFAYLCYTPHPQQQQKRYNLSELGMKI